MAVATIETDTNERAGPLGEAGLVYGVVIATLAMLRVTIPGGLRTVWADDAVMVAASRWLDPWSAISFSYHGYLHVAPMLVAMSLAWLPVKAIPVALVIMWAASVGALAVLVARTSRSFLDRLSSRMMLGASIALIPIAAFESLGSIANLQWYLLATAIVVLVGTPEGRGEKVTAAVVLGMAAASAPSALAIAPLVVWRHDRRWSIGAYGVGIAAQFAVVISEWGSRDTGGDWFNVWDISTSYLWSATNGVTSDAWDPFGPGWLAPPLLAIVAVAVWRSPRRFLPFLVMTGAAFAVWWFTYGGAGGAPARPRYMIVPAVCFVAVLMRATEQWARVHVAVIFVLLAAWVGGFQASALRTEARSWAHQVDAAECADGEILIGIAPQGYGAIALPCD